MTGPMTTLALAISTIVGVPDDTEAGLLVFGIGATTAALHCPDLQIAHDVIDDHHRRLAGSQVNVEREPYRSIWLDAAVESAAAAKQDPLTFCASLRRDYGPTGAIFPGLVRDRP